MTKFRTFKSIVLMQILRIQKRSRNLNLSQILRTKKLLIYIHFKRINFLFYKIIFSYQFKFYQNIENQEKANEKLNIQKKTHVSRISLRFQRNRCQMNPTNICIISFTFLFRVAQLCCQIIIHSMYVAEHQTSSTAKIES